MSNAIPRFLNDLPLLGELTESEVEGLARFSVRRMIQKELAVQMAGEPIEYLGFILSGRGREWLSLPDGRMSLIRPLKSGSLFNVTGLAKEQPGNICVSCLPGTELLMVGVEGFRQLIPHSVRLTFALTKILAEREVAMQQRIALLLTPRSDERVQTYQMWYQLELGATPVNSPRLQLTHEQIGIDLNLSRETVSRIISRNAGST